MCNVENNDEWFLFEIEICLGDVVGVLVVLFFLVEKLRVMVMKKKILLIWYYKLLFIVKEWYICLDRFDYNFFN